MSDNESEYYSGSGSDSEIVETPQKKITIKIGGNQQVSTTIDDDSEEENSEEEIDDDDLEIQIGGDDLDSDPDDDASDNMSDDDKEEGEVDESIDIQVEDTNKKSKINKPKKPVQIEIQSDDDDDDDYDERYLQKFDNELTKNYINEFHPECLIHNYDEISKLTNVVRDSNNIIIDPLHKTIPFLTKYEKARILGQRAKQIEIGAKPFVQVPENVIDSYIIAELELQQKRIPFIIRRPIPGGACEYWNLKDLEIISF